MTVTFHQYQSSNLSKHVLHVVVCFVCGPYHVMCRRLGDQLLRTTMVGFLLKNSERNKLELEYHKPQIIDPVWPGYHGSVHLGMNLTMYI